MKKKILPFIIVPLLLLVAGSLMFLAIEDNWNLETTSFVVFFITLIYIKFFEWQLPLKKNWSSEKNELFVDLKHLLFSTAVFDAIAKSLAISLLLFVNEKLTDPLLFWESIPFFITFLIANLVGEFFPYLYHRISHVGNRKSSISIFLWKIHAIHHIPISLNWFKTNWIHPINMFLNTTLKIVPLLFLGFSTEIIFCVGVTHVVIAYLSHANIKTRTGFLDYLIVTPKVHQFHHSTKLEEAKNFGNILPFWDLLFGTYFNKKDDVETVGVFQDGYFSYPEHQKFWSQLVYPFTSNKRKGTSSKGKKKMAA